eukprot:3802812-Prymnesium_polylepis.2
MRSCGASREAVSLDDGDSEDCVRMALPSHAAAANPAAPSAPKASCMAPECTVCVWPCVGLCAARNAPQAIFGSSRCQGWGLLPQTDFWGLGQSPRNGVRGSATRKRKNGGFKPILMPFLAVFQRDFR